jgi:four helix bundle protein
MEENPKLEILNSKQIQSPKTQRTKRYDLGERTFLFAKRIITYVNELPKTIANIEISKQIVRASGSVGANYIEAEESLSKKDFVMRMKISRKEAKESIYWLGMSEPKEEWMREKEKLIQEATELMKIFGSIVEKCK